MTAPDGGALTTAAGEHHDFDIVVSAVGLFTRPVLPGLVEQQPFTGTVYPVQRSPTWILPKPDRPYSARKRWLFAHIPLLKRM